MKQIFICPFLLFFALTLAAAPRILLAPDASPYEKFAAEELRRVWEISSGVQLTITSDAIPEKGDIVIGTSTNPRIKQQMKQLGLSTERKHEAAVQEIDGVLHLAGQTPRAAVDAVMLFLRENIGARWLWPGADGEFIPKHSKITFDGIRRNCNPGFPQRTIGLCGWDKRPAAFELFMSRNFATDGGCTQYDLPYLPKKFEGNLEFIRSRASERGMTTTYGGHTTFHEVPLKQRPELYALREGKRTVNQLCWSHPDNPKLVADHLVRTVKKFKYDINAYSLSVHDNEQYCQCPKCLDAIRKGGSYSRLYFQFADAVAREIKKQHPGARVGSLAYLAYARLPGIELKYLDWINYCPWSRCFSHKHHQCQPNRNSFAEAEKWCRTGIDVSIYGYFFDSLSPAVALPWGNLIKDEVTAYRKMGVKRLAPELMLASPKNALPELQDSVTYRLSIYLYLQLMYQPELTVKEIIQDWCDTAYGKEAGKDMFACHMAMLDAFDQVKSNLTGMFSRPNSTSEELFAVPGLAERCESLLRSAERKTQNPRYLKNLQRERRLYENLKKAGVSTLHETFFPVPYRPDARSTASALLGKSGASIYYTPNEIVLNMVPDGEISLATPHDEKAGILHRIKVSNGQLSYTVLSDGRESPGEVSTLKLESGNESVTLRIPFHVLKIAPPLSGEIWRFRIRNGAESYPEIRKYPPVNSDLAYAVFMPDVKEKFHRILVMPDQKDFERRTPGIFRDTAHQYGFAVDFALNPQDAERNLDAYDVILLKLKTGAPSPEFFRGALLTAAKRGALVILAGEKMKIPLEISFGDAAYSFKEIQTLLSPTVKVVPELRKKIMAPRDIHQGNRYPTLFAHRPQQPENWQTLFTALDKNKQEQPIMLWRKVGKGAILVTNCEMGLYHGWRLFGDLAPQAPESTFRLILNLKDNLL